MLTSDSWVRGDSNICSTSLVIPAHFLGTPLSLHPLMPYASVHPRPPLHFQSPCPLLDPRQVSWSTLLSCSRKFRGVFFPMSCPCTVSFLKSAFPEDVPPSLFCVPHISSFTDIITSVSCLLLPLTPTLSCYPYGPFSSSTPDTLHGGQNSVPPSLWALLPAFHHYKFSCITMLRLPRSPPPLTIDFS